MWGPSLASAIARATPPVTPLTTTVDGTVISVALQGGCPGQLARIEFQLRFSDGQTDTWPVLLPIVARGILEVGTMAASPVVTQGATPALLATIDLLAISGSAANIQGTVLARNVATNKAVRYAYTVTATNLGTPQVSVAQQSVTAFECPHSWPDAG